MDGVSSHPNAPGVFSCDSAPLKCSNQPRVLFFPQMDFPARCKIDVPVRRDDGRCGAFVGEHAVEGRGFHVLQPHRRLHRERAAVQGDQITGAGGIRIDGHIDFGVIVIERGRTAQRYSLFMVVSSSPAMFVQRTPMFPCRRNQSAPARFASSAGLRPSPETRRRYFRNGPK